jgi:alkylation response protein AidB-like acyl-CoA dehydrogenase
MLEPLSLTRIPPADEALREPVRAFLKSALQHLPPEQRARSWMGFDADFSRRLAGEGWIGLTLPKRYGGGERSAFARFVVVEELLAAGAPVSAHWIADRQSAPLILRYGSETQRQFFLPRICRAEAFFCIGMSEPGAGSDLASVQSRATRTPSGWRIRGRKLWTTNAHRSHYVIALLRSSGNPEDRQKGLSQFIVDLQQPGVSIQPIEDLAGDRHFSEIVFDDVEVADDALIGNEGAGWEQVNAELAFERSGPERILSSIVLVEELLRWLRELGDAAPADAVTALGSILAQLMVLRTMSIAVTGKLVRGESPLTHAALVKDLGTTLEQQIPDVVARLVGADATLQAPASLLRTLEYVALMAPSYSLRGGTREILRGMIARGLGLR